MVFNELQNLYIADIHPSMQHAIHLTDWFSLYGVIQFFFRTRTIPHVSNCCRGKQAILNRRMQKTVVSEKARDPQVTIGVNTKAVEFWMIWGSPNSRNAPVGYVFPGVKMLQQVALFAPKLCQVQVLPLASY